MVPQLQGVELVALCSALHSGRASWQPSRACRARGALAASQRRCHPLLQHLANRPTNPPKPAASTPPPLPPPTVTQMEMVRRLSAGARSGRASTAEKEAERLQSEEAYIEKPFVAKRR